MPVAPWLKHVGKEKLSANRVYCNKQIMFRHTTKFDVNQVSRAAETPDRCKVNDLAMEQQNLFLEAPVNIASKSACPLWATRLRRRLYFEQDLLCLIVYCL